jgi:hypothetical protein
MNPAVVVSAYNRPDALARLLGSLQAADYPEDEKIPLVISIDQAAEHPEVRQVAQDFLWVHGPKQVICREEHLGPVGHFYACGSLAETYGAVVFLEDDLFAAPVYYHYARQALEKYAPDAAVGGISLYALWFNGYNQLPFIPLADGADTFFLQLPYTQGLAFTADQWLGFARWRQSAPNPEAVEPPLHESWARFRPDEWFPHFTRYLVSENRYFVFPRVSLTSGFGDVGTHFARPSAFFQAPLQYGKTRYQFLALEDSTAVYDSFFEILPDRLERMAPHLQGLDYSVDLYATHTPATLRTPYVLTTRPCRGLVAGYRRSMLPHEANLIHPAPGEDISFCRVEDLRWDWLARQDLELKNSLYFDHGRRSGLRRAIKIALFERLNVPLKG